MRLKIAEVLVEQEDHLIRPLARALPSDKDHATGDLDAALIVERHMQLWALRVYAPFEVRENEEQSKRLLGFLRQELGMPLTSWDGEPVEPLARLAANEIGDRQSPRWSGSERRAAEKIIEDRAAKGEYERFEDLLDWTDDGRLDDDVVPESG
jgi:hypothetical protein